MKPINVLYQIQPGFVRDVLHMHFFKTSNYYESRMNDFPRLKISSQLKVSLSFVEKEVDNSSAGRFSFIDEDLGFIGLPQIVEFPTLFNKLIVSVTNPKDIDDMFDRLNNSNDHSLIQLSNKISTLNISYVSELYDFVKRKECSTTHNWYIDEFLNGAWNFTLLALNNSVWDKAFELMFFKDLFKEELKELELIDAGNLTSDIAYNDHIHRIDLLIKSKLS